MENLTASVSEKPVEMGNQTAKIAIEEYVEMASQVSTIFNDGKIIEPGCLEPSKKEPVSMTNFIDLNLDCIEAILRHLPPEDLLNANDSNTDLRLLVNMVYRHQYAKKTAHMDFLIHEYVRNRPLDNRIDDIRIHDLKTSLQMLRTAGNLIQLLNINFENYDLKHCASLFRYMNEYCNEKLSQAHIHNIPESAFIEPIFQKPFLKLKKLGFFNTNLHGEMVEFNKWYPALRTLSLMDCKLIDPQCIEMNFPSLRHLYLDNAIPSESIESMLRLNPQLKTFHFIHDYSSQILETASDHLTKLERLSIEFRSDTNGYMDIISSKRNNDINFQNLNTLIIRLVKNAFLSFPQMPMSFGPIIQFHLFSSCRLNDNFQDFLSRHPTMTYLFFHGPVTAIDKVFAMVSNALPNLREMYFVKLHLDFPEIVALMNRYTSIQEIGCIGFDNLTRDHLNACYGKYQVEYCSSAHSNYTTIKRIS